MKQLDSKIISNKSLSADFFELVLKIPGIKPKPGQFVELRLTDGLEPFLNRPFSVAWSKDSRIGIWYQIRGKGTSWLKQQKSGKKINFIGPLGNSFPKLPADSIYIVGGCGTGPIHFLSTVQKPALLLIGGHDTKHIYQRQAFKKLGIRTLVSTDDGSLGYKGLVTDLLSQELSKKPYKAVAACGPERMMSAVAKIAESQKINCYLSFEAYMACGLGACFGCAVKTKTGHKRVCHDGPVFKSTEIEWTS